MIQRFEVTEGTDNGSKDLQQSMGCTMAESFLTDLSESLLLVGPMAEIVGNNILTKKHVIAWSGPP